MRFEILIFAQIFGAIFGGQNGTFFERRVKRWGNYGNWNGNYGPYGGGGAPPPNNNVAIGYPTAYGLGGMAPRGNEINPAPKFVVRCINGGAHIGQCRLDEDAICIALGGTVRIKIVESDLKQNFS
uniref:Uncharacterized protein n=1 Tax=Panagrolaimus davidi TaxID=227884 RepID=A0A914P182_9BILA